MKADIKQRWIERLEAGPRKARLALRDDQGGRCCLGHLCDLAVEDGVVSWRHADGSWACGWSGQTAVLPEEVVEWAGGEGLDEHLLTRANDDNPGYPLDLIRALPED